MSNLDILLKQAESSLYELEDEKAVESITDAFTTLPDPVDIAGFINMLPRKMKRKFHSDSSFSKRFKANINKK